MIQASPHMSRSSIILNVILGLLWGIMHLAISLFNLWSLLIYNLECYLISFGLLRKYRYLSLDRLKYLAIMVDGKEAKNTVKIRQLLCWLSTMAVKYICLYDIEGVLNKSFEPAMKGSRDGKAGEYLGIGASISHSSHKGLVVECISGSDGKEGIAKAANLLCSTYLNGDTHGNGKREPTFTEADMASSLKAVVVDQNLIFFSCMVLLDVIRLSCMEITVYGNYAYGTTKINEIWCHSESFI